MKVPRPPKKKPVSTVPEKEKPPPKSRTYAPIDPVKKPQRTNRPNDYGRSKENLNKQKPQRQINQKGSSLRYLKWVASSRWSFGPNSASGGIETVTIGEIHPL